MSKQFEDNSDCWDMRTILEHELTPDDIGVITSKPKHPHLAIDEVRLETFKLWSFLNSVSKYPLCEAGFFFEGFLDVVTCFYCGGHISSWYKRQAPWVTHAMSFPHCDFLLNTKGKSFVDTIQSYKEGGDSVFSLHHYTLLTSFRGPRWRANTREAAIRAVCYHTDYKTADVKNISKYVLEESTDSLDLFKYLNADYQPLENTEQQEIDALKDKIKHFHRDRQCVVCLDTFADTVFFPCKHLKTCYKCSLPLEKCPWCRADKQSTFRVTLIPIVERIQLHIPIDLDIGLRILNTELQQLRSSVLCRICTKSVRNIVYMPCGHLIHCEQCANREYTVNKIIKCKLCSRVILATAFVFHYQPLSIED